jgi:hypothetical protein
METALAGRHPAVVIALCAACNVTVHPGDEIDESGEYPRSSAERRERERS